MEREIGVRILFGFMCTEDDQWILRKSKESDIVELLKAVLELPPHHPTVWNFTPNPPIHYGVPTLKSYF